MPKLPGPILSQAAQGRLRRRESKLLGPERRDGECENLAGVASGPREFSCHLQFRYACVRLKLPFDHIYSTSSGQTFSFYHSVIERAQPIDIKRVMFSLKCDSWRLWIVYHVHFWVLLCKEHLALSAAGYMVSSQEHHESQMMWRSCNWVPRQWTPCSRSELMYVVDSKSSCLRSISKSVLLVCNLMDMFVANWSYTHKT